MVSNLPSTRENMSLCITLTFFKPVDAAILFGVPDRGQADIDGDDFPCLGGAEHAGDAAAAAQIQHPVTFAAIFAAGLFVSSGL